MVRKKQLVAGQLSLSYPPELSDELQHDWRRLKTIYPAFLILLAKGDYYATLERDALTISQVTGHLLEPGNQFTYFHVTALQSVFHRLTEAGYFLAICHPPEQLEQHLFT